MKLLILSDIHANLSALNSVLENATSKYTLDGLVLLGDIIDYGMRPNETIEKVKNLKLPIVSNIFGNHEYALIKNKLDNFSSQRGKDFSNYTLSQLSSESKDYINTNMNSKGYEIKSLESLKFLFIHGSLEDIFWNSIKTDEIIEDYSNYDYVLSGHSHKPHMFEKYYETNNSLMRNKKRTIFINPGSVGQPRNHNPKAQYVILDVKSGYLHFNAVDYDIKYEQSIYTNKINEFYKNRLSIGV